MSTACARSSHVAPRIATGTSPPVMNDAPRTPPSNRVVFPALGQAIIRDIGGSYQKLGVRGSYQKLERQAIEENGKD